MKEPHRRPAAISLRLYRALANAFPHEFKNVYGDELLQVTEDSIEAIWERYRVPGLFRLLLDIAIRIPAEYMAELRQDVRYGFRRLAGSPGFTAVAIISLGLGIGAATSFFSELNGMVLRRVPGVSRPNELVTPSMPASYPQYRRYRDRSDLFASSLAYVAPVPFGVSVDGTTQRVWGHLVTPSYFSALGVRPSLGRVFGDEHELSGAAPAVVVSYRFWRGRMGADPSVIGRELRINGHLCTVLGVGPEEFLGASPMMFPADLWLPLSVGELVAPELAAGALENYSLKMFQVVGRLRSGVTAVRAEAELDAVARQLEQEYNDPGRNWKGRRVVLKNAGGMIPIRDEELPVLIALPVVVLVLVLLIACSNVANMMLARAADRRREIALRLGLGASRARLIRQLLTESMMLAAGAGVLGCLLTMWLMRLASRMRIPNPMPINLDVEPDGVVLLFALALTILTGLAFGLVPAIKATRPDLVPALKEGGAAHLPGYRKLGLRNVLVLSQVTTSLMLLLLTGTIVVGFGRIAGTEVGLDPENLYLLSLDPVRDGRSGEQSAAFLRKLLDRVEDHPDVISASLTETLPTALSSQVTLSAASSGDSGTRTAHRARKCVVGRDYFQTTGIPILRGRGFRRQDEEPDALAVVVNEALVCQFWPGEDPIGRSIVAGEAYIAEFNLFVDSYLDYRLGAAVPRTFDIVGVAKDVKRGSGMSRPDPAIYFPIRQADFAQPPLQGITLLVRGKPGADILGLVRREVSFLDDDVSLFNARTMGELIDQMLFPVSVGVSSYGVMGLIGLVLASVGLAGVTAYSVARRGREIGIRIALGARAADVLGLVMKEGVTLVAVGAVLGLASAWGAIRLLSASIESVYRAASQSTSDPILLIGAPLLLVGLTVLACYVPARRSLRIDPAAALRQE